MGVTGLETAFAVLNTDLVLPGVLDLATVVERMSAGAVRLRLRRCRAWRPTPRRTSLSSTSRPNGRPGPTGGRAARRTLASPAASSPGARMMTIVAGQVAFRQRRQGSRVATRGECPPGPDERLRPPRGRHALRGRELRRRGRERRRRGRLQHLDDRLSGGGHRPLVRGPAHHLHLSDDRQLRRRRAGHGVGPHPRPRGDHARRP